MCKWFIALFLLLAGKLMKYAYIMANAHVVVFCSSFFPTIGGQDSRFISRLSLRDGIENQLKKQSSCCPHFRESYGRLRADLERLKQKKRKTGVV